MSAPINPRPFLQNLINTVVTVRLKWASTEYDGRLVSADAYMNLQLADTEEYINLKKTGTLGMCLVRCNNILWISPKQEREDDGTNGAAPAGAAAGDAMEE